MSEMVPVEGTSPPAFEGLGTPGASSSGVSSAGVSSAEARGGGLAELLRRAERLAAGDRRILGIVGSPGSGKSTLATMVADHLGERARYVPMDGYHLANVELVRLGRRDRKGAVDTFDAAGYLALLRRLRAQTDDVVYAPQFRREIEEPIAGAIPVPRNVPLIVTEGNYLLVDRGPWQWVRSLLDEVWFCAPDDEVRLDRLIRRHIAFGKSAVAAREWSLGTDQRNAVLIESTRDAADLLVDTAAPGMQRPA